MAGKVASVASQLSSIGRARMNRPGPDAAALNLWLPAIVVRAIRGAIAVGAAGDPSAA